MPVASCLYFTLESKRLDHVIDKMHMNLHIKNRLESVAKLYCNLNFSFIFTIFTVLAQYHDNA